MHKSLCQSDAKANKQKVCQEKPKLDQNNILKILINHRDVKIINTVKKLTHLGRMIKKK